MTKAERQQARAFICRIDGVHKLNAQFKCKFCGMSNTEATVKEEPYMYTGPEQAHMHGRIYGRG